MNQLDNIKMVFIVCMGRSGSTLLQTMFYSIDEFSAPPEALFIIRLRSRYETVSNWDEKTKKQFAKDVLFNRKLKNFWGINQEAIRENLDLYNVTSFSQACKVVYITYHQKYGSKNTLYICDKNPVHSYFMPELARIFPEAHFIHLVRDPRAVIASQKKTFDRTSIYNLCARWTYNTSQVVKSASEIPVQMSRVFYEELVKEPQKVFGKLLTDLKLDYTFDDKTRVASLEENNKRRRYLSLNPHKSALEPIALDKVEKWRNELPESEARLIEDLCADIANTIAPYNLVPSGLADTQKFEKSRLKFEKRMNTIKKMMEGPIWIKRLAQNSISLVADRKKAN